MNWINKNKEVLAAGNVYVSNSKSKGAKNIKVTDVEEYIDYMKALEEKIL